MSLLDLPSTCHARLNTLSTQYPLPPQVTLLGSILSNTLLVLGCACLAGGLTAQKPTFNKVAAVSNAALLQIAVLGLEVGASEENGEEGRGT